MIHNSSNKTLILLRHGQSIWNRDNRFTGWTDVPLSDQGRQEAVDSGRWMRNEGVQIDVAFTSVLQRAIKTLWIVLETTDQMWVPVYRSWRLNERHYGALQGENKSQMAEKVGESKWEKGMPHQTASRIQTPAAQCSAYCHLLQPLAQQSEPDC